MGLLIINSAIVGILIFLFVSFIFIIALIRNDNSIMDIAYGLTFLSSIGIATIVSERNNNISLIIISCIALWSLRLSFRIFRKNHGKPEDFRYATWRTNWSERGRWYFLLRSYLQIYLLQGSIIFLVAFPAVIALAAPTAASSSLLWLGIIVFAIGLAYETIADWQLDRFIARKQAGTESAEIMTKGLFAYSRRPNYFGETLIWWGMAIMVLPLSYGWLALISPLLITFIVTKITGPMLEQAFLKKYPEAYGTYMKTVNYLIPGPRRNN